MKFSFSASRSTIALQTSIVNQSFPIKIFPEHLAHETLLNDSF